MVAMTCGFSHLPCVRCVVVVSVFLLSAVPTATAGTIHVQYGNTYQEDTLALRIVPESPDHGEGDSALLPSGATLSPMSSPQLLPPNGYPFFAGISVFDVTSWQVGYKPCTTFSYWYDGPAIGASVTIGNPDTVWEDAVGFPDSLHALDYSYRSPVDTFYNKWCMSQRDTSYIPNWQAIIYLRGSDSRHMKLQALGVPEDSLAYAYWWSTAFRIRWAVDSAGNGLFKHDVSAVESPGRPHLPARAAHGSGPGVELFDLCGARVARYGPAGRGCGVRVVVTRSSAAAACHIR